MAKVVYGNLVKSISGNFGASNGYTRNNQQIIRKRRGTVTGETQAQRLQRNAARYIGMALTTGTPHLRSAWPLIQSGTPRNWRAEKRYKESSWFANMFTAFRRSLNDVAISTKTEGQFGVGFGTVTTHKPTGLADYLTWTNRHNPNEVACRIIVTTWSQQGAWISTALRPIDFNIGSLTLGILPNCTTMLTIRQGQPELSNFGEAIVFLNQIHLENKPTL